MTLQANGGKPAPVELGTWDVVVCGGGPAGCAAAIGAARHGARVLLLDKHGFVGGAAVTQLVSVVLSTNGVDFQGIWHEWARRLLARRGMAPLLRRPSPVHAECFWWRTSLDVEMIKVVWQELLEEAGVTTLLLAHLCDAWVEDGALVGVYVHTRAGLGRIRAGRLIDATGDAALCHAAGIPWERGMSGKLWSQKVALNYVVGYSPAARPNPPLPGEGGTVAFRPEMRTWVQLERIDPLDPFALSEALRTARRQIAANAGQMLPGSFLSATASEPGVRTSRLVQGIKRVSDDDAWELRQPPDSIARASWEIDIHAPDDDPAPARSLKGGQPEYAPHARQLRDGGWFGVPYGCLVPVQSTNLLVAGRCLSAEMLAQSALRIQQTCMATGQAAGVAAALSLAAKVPPATLDPAAVVKQLAIDRDVEPAFST